jgi:hypothetical protein
VDHRTDIYSLGLVLYELLILSPPFRADSRELLLRQIATKSLTPATWRNRSVPRDLESIIHKAAARDPDERYQSAGGLAEDLQRFLDGKPVSAPPYRYRLNVHEIVAARPGGVVAAAFVFFFASVVTFLGTVSFAGMALFGGSGAPNGFLGGLGILTTLTVASFVIGRGLLAGRGWAWWLGGLAALLFVAISLYSGVSLFQDVVPNLHQSGEPGASTRTVLATVLSMASIPVLAACSALGVIFVLLRRNTRNWFRFARQVRREYRQLRTAQA